MLQERYIFIGPLILHCLEPNSGSVSGKAEEALLMSLLPYIVVSLAVTRSVTLP